MKSIGLVQINNSFSGQNYFPFSTGLIQSYAEAHAKLAEEFEFIEMIYKRMPVAQAVEHLKGCAIAGFSTYVWNARLSLQIARELKAANPACLIVFGGPQVPNRSEDFLRAHPFIDLCIHGEGEQSFAELLTHYPTGDWSRVQSVSYFKDGRFVTTPRRTSVGLDEVPSPYLNGMFDRLIQNHPTEQWLGLWETNRGCPFSCTFCDWGSATQAKVKQYDLTRLYREIDWFAKNRVEFIFCCDANFGILIRDVDIARYVAKVKRETGYPKSLSVQNTKNATERAYEVQKLLASEGLNKGVTLSVQSMDPVTLSNIKRANISLESYQELQRRFMKDKIETYSDMILALPGETYDSFMDGMDQIITNGQHNRIQFNNLSILPNAEMGDPEYQAKFGMVTIESKIINMHGSLTEVEDDATQERQQLVIATEAMPREAWVRTRAHCWMAALLHFDKILQIPLVIVHQTTGIKYRQIFEAFMNGDLTKNHPILDEIRTFFFHKAVRIQEGDEEYCQSEAWLNIWWPADEYIFIKMVHDRTIQRFYQECGELLARIVANHGGQPEPQLLEESVRLNQALLKVPFQVQDETVALSHNIPEYYRSLIENHPIPLARQPAVCVVEKSKNSYLDWKVWLQEVVWYGNKKGGYLHGNYQVEPQLDGHY